MYIELEKGSLQALLQKSEGIDSTTKFIVALALARMHPKFL
jgi:hypothetical protein